MTSLSAGDLTNLRTKQSKVTPYLSVLKPTELLTATVNGAHNRGARSLAYNNGTGTAGNFALIEAGQTLETDTADGTKKVRVKSISGNQVSGTVTLDENAIEWAAADDIRILHNYELFPVFPRITGGVFYKYYDTAYSNQNSQPDPVAIAGPHQAGFLAAGSLILNVPVGDSYTIASGATISSRTVTVKPGTDGVEYTIGAYAGGVIPITYATAGTYWVKTTVTDSNSKSQVTYRCHFVHGSSSMPYTAFTVSPVSGSWQSGGWRFTVTATGDVTAADFPDGTLAVLWYTGKLDDVEGYVNLFDVGDNIICAGYIRTDNDTDSYETGAGSVEFEVVTPEALLDQMTEFGSVSIEAVASPSTWYEYASWLTVGRAVHHELRWHSTTFSCVDVYGLLDNTLGMQVGAFTESSLLQRVNGLGYQRGHFAKLVSDRLGRLRFVTDLQMLSDAGRAAQDTVFSITNADISGSINITRRQIEQNGYADIDGFSFDGTTATPLISIAPGYVDGISISLAEFRGAAGVSAKNQVMQDQADSNSKAGRLLAKENNSWGEIRLSFRGNYLGAFDIQNGIGFYTWGIANASLKRQLSLNGVKLICRGVDHTIDVQAGTLLTSAVFETEAQGADGIPGNYPTEYPAASEPSAPTWNEPAQAAVYGISLIKDYSDSIGKAVLVDVNTPAFITPVALDGTEALDNFGVCMLSSTQALAAYRKPSASNHGRVQVLDISGTTITPGTPASWGSVATAQHHLVRLSAVQALMVYKNTEGDEFRTGVVDISGSTATVGATVAIDNAIGAIGGWASVCALTSTKCLAAYFDANDYDGKVAVIDISGSTVTPGAPQVFLAGSLGVDRNYSTSLARLTDTKAVLVYERESSTDYIEAVILDISGTTITVNSVVHAFTLDSAVTGLFGVPAVVPLDSTHFLIVCATALPSNVVKSIIGTESGSSISFGTPVTLTGTYTSPGPCVTLVSASKAAFLYRDYSTSRAVYIATLGISGTTITDNGDDVGGISNGSTMVIDYLIP